MTALPDISRKPYALGMLAACAAAVAAGLGIASVSGEPVTSGTLLAIALTLVAGLTLCALPLAGPPLVTPDRWGLMVLAASMGRTLLVLLAMLVLVEGQGLPKKPVGFGLLAGALIMMFAEAAIAVHLLMKRERLRTPPARPNPVQTAPTSPRSVD